MLLAYYAMHIIMWKANGYFRHLSHDTQIHFCTGLFYTLLWTVCLNLNVIYIVIHALFIKDNVYCLCLAEETPKIEQILKDTCNIIINFLFKVSNASL